MVLTYTGFHKLEVIRAIRRDSGKLSLRDAKTLIDNTPSLIKAGAFLPEAEALKDAVRSGGGDAMIIPAIRGTRGIFVLPERNG